jgi:hypothetical protein
MFMESAFDPRAKSPAGAMGIAQFMPGTVKDMTERFGFDKGWDPYDPQLAREAQETYLMSLLGGQWNKGDQEVKLAKALGAYNYGVGNMLNFLEKEKAAGKDIYTSTDWVADLNPETKNYIKGILYGFDENTKTTEAYYDKKLPEYFKYYPKQAQYFGSARVQAPQYKSKQEKPLTTVEELPTGLDPRLQNAFKILKKDNPKYPHGGRHGNPSGPSITPTGALAKMVESYMPDQNQFRLTAGDAPFRTISQQKEMISESDMRENMELLYSSFPGVGELIAVKDFVKGAIAGDEYAMGLAGVDLMLPFIPAAKAMTPKQFREAIAEAGELLKGWQKNPKTAPFKAKPGSEDFSFGEPKAGKYDYVQDKLIEDSDIMSMGVVPVLHKGQPSGRMSMAGTYVPGTMRHALMRESDFPFDRLSRELQDQVKGSGASGLMSQAINQALKNRGYRMVSSGAHSAEGMARYGKLEKKGIVSRVDGAAGDYDQTVLDQWGDPIDLDDPSTYEYLYHADGGKYRIRKKR